MSESGLQSPAVAKQFEDLKVPQALDRVDSVNAQCPPVDVDTVIEAAFDRLYAKMQTLSPRSPAEHAERQSLTIIRSLAAELLMAGQALQKVAEALKMQPNATVTQRLQMANWTIKAASRAQQAAKSILG